MKQAYSNYKWMGLGDVNGFFGLMFDNIAQLSFLAGTLIVGFNFPSDVV
jgi:AGZA family xanthine/uracil permease-like MFS transporter